MRPVARIVAELRELLPLRESDVERFEDLTDELCEANDELAATEVLRLLDDKCRLEGVMESTVLRLELFSPEVRTGAFLKTLREMQPRAGHLLHDVVRLLICDHDRIQELRKQAHKADNESVVELCGLLRKVGKFSRYESAAKQLLAEFAPE